MKLSTACSCRPSSCQSQPQAGRQKELENVILRDKRKAKEARKEKSPKTFPRESAALPSPASSIRMLWSTLSEPLTQTPSHWDTLKSRSTLWNQPSTQTMMSDDLDINDLKTAPGGNRHSKEPHNAQASSWPSQLPPQREMGQTRA